MQRDCSCIPPVGSVSSFDTEDGWKLVFRQILPSTDRENGGYFQADELSRNTDDESASTYSVLNQLEQMRGSDHMYSLSPFVLCVDIGPDFKRPLEFLTVPMVYAQV